MSLIIDELDFFDEVPVVSEEIVQKFRGYLDNAMRNAITPERREISLRWPDQGQPMLENVKDVVPFSTRLLITHKNDEWRYALCVQLSDERVTTKHPGQAVLYRFAGLWGLLYSEIEGDDFYARAVFKRDSEGRCLSVMCGPLNQFWKEKYNLK